MSDLARITADEIGKIADQYYEAFPDVRTVANEWGATLLRKHTGLQLNPDFIYWNHFDNAQNNSLCHSGWQHYGPPTLSMNVTELVMRRFNIYDQINAIDLDSDSGFYHVNKSVRFDQTNEVPLLPSLIMADFWSNDFSTLYKQRLEQFWQEQASNGRLLLKALFFGYAWTAYMEGALSKPHLLLLLHTLGGPTALPPTLANLRAESTARRFAKVYTFNIGLQAATDILRIKAPDNTEVLYMAPSWFKPFHSEEEMYNWLRHVAAEPRERTQLLRHFSDYSLEAEHRTLLSRILDRIQAQPWTATQTDLNHNSREITEDAFSFLFATVRRRLEHDASLLLQSNYELRKELLLEELDALVRISSGLAPADPLIALVTVGAASLSFASHLTQSIYGKTRQQRQAAFRKTMLDAVTVLLDLPLLKGVGKDAWNEFNELDTLELSESDDTQAFSSANEDDASLYEAYEVERDIEDLPEGSGLRKGVYSLDAQHSFIRMDGRIFQVRYIEPLERWYVINPETPDNLTGAWPVQRDWQGRWILYTEPTVQTPVEVSTPEMETERLRHHISDYDTNPDYEPLIEALTGRDAARLLSGPLDSVFHDARNELLNLRKTLAHDSLELLAARLPSAPAVPSVTDAMKPARFFETVYSDAYGLIIGEAKGSIASKKLLIKYMAQLKQNGVDTLFMEGLLKDLHQKWIDQFWRTGYMPRVLEKRLLELYNQTSRLDVSRYTHYRVLTEARRQGIKIKALDCAVSIASDGLPDGDAALSHRMRVFYASERLKAQQSTLLPSRWIALLDQTRAGTHYGIKGVAEVTGTVHLRVKDIDRLLPTRMSIDTGEVLKNPPGLVKGDVKIELGTLEDLHEQELLS